MSEYTDLSNNQKIVADMKVVVSDAEEILRETAAVAGGTVVEARERLNEHLRAAKARLADADAALRGKTKAACCAANECIRKNPWQSIGVAASVGLLLGILIGRR